MADNIVHFRAAKKRVKQRKKEKIAQENRVKFGTKKSDNRIVAADKRKAETHIEGHKLTPPKIEK